MKPRRLLRRLSHLLFHRRCDRVIDDLRAERDTLKLDNKLLREDRRRDTRDINCLVAASRRSQRNWESKWRRIAAAIGYKGDANLTDAVQNYVDATAQDSRALVTFALENWDEWCRFLSRRARERAAKKGPVQ